MAEKKNFCCVEDFPVLVPYRDLVKLVEVANNLEQYNHGLSLANSQLSALRVQYGELLQKVQEIDKNM